MTNHVDKPTFNVLSLCSGVGGLELGIGLAVPNARTVCFVEMEAYCCEVLAERMEDQCLDEAPIWTDLRTFDGRAWSGVVDCVAGGYPCQPFSKTGKRLAERDERHLWPEVSRIVQEVKPRWCFFENVANHLRAGFERVEYDLRKMGYRVAAGLFTAEELGYPQQRERLYIMALTDGVATRSRCHQAQRQVRANPDRGGSKTLSERRPSERGFTAASTPLVDLPPRPDQANSWHKQLVKRPWLSPAAQPNICGMANGMAPWVDRLRLCGNGVVPDVAAFAWNTLGKSLTEEQ